MLHFSCVDDSNFLIKVRIKLLKNKFFKTSKFIELMNFSPEEKQSVFLIEIKFT